MKDMDAATKLFTGLPEVFTALVDFALRKTGFHVVAGSLKERNSESVAHLPGMRKWYKKVSNDIVAELEVTDGDVTAKMLVALENQTCMSNVMTGRNLMATAVRWDNWRRETKRDHKARKELKSSQELLDGVLPGDRMTPPLLLVIHFGQEAWTGELRFTDTLDCPPALKPMLAECPSNVISFYNLSIDDINQMPDTLRTVGKSIHYGDDIEKLCYELKTDPAFYKLLEEGPDEALDVITIATGLDMQAMKQQKEKNMEQTVSKFEQYFINKGIDIGKDKGRIEGRAEGEAIGRAEGEAIGRAEGEAIGRVVGESNTMLKFIQIRRNRHLSEQQILKDLQSDFELDEATARQYMQAKPVNA